MSSVLSALLEYLAPLRSIAESQRIISELYEAELATRPTPIYRVTEKPRESDTTVTYTGDSRPRQSWFGRTVDEVAPEYDEEEDRLG